MSDQFKKNRLKLEKSPYLMQHQDNPVWWQPWDNRILSEALTSKKLIFLSIGYSTCHWCHVMERESFEQDDVAEILNRFYISIKVDREERPDLDAYFMRSIQVMGYRGGWPLSVILTPDLKPFWGGTYFPKENFKTLLLQIADYWQKRPEEILQKSDLIIHHLKEWSNLFPPGDFSPEKGKDLLEKVFFDIKKNFEPEFGGFGKAPKFPPGLRLRFLLRIGTENLIPQESGPLFQMIHATLQGMFKGGIYDHLGGGFARYSTDNKWLVPHFEKMLYDNANLSLCYLEAFQITGNMVYANVAKETLQYVQRDMTHSFGGFYSAEDADSEGKEGAFYLWTREQLQKILTPDEFQIVSRVYGIKDEGNFEDQTNILNLLQTSDLSIVFSSSFISIKKKLFAEREKRVHPFKDDKVITAWNGSMISSFAKAYQVFHDPSYLESAQKCARFLQDSLDKEGQLRRRYRSGEAKYDAFLDDYAFLIQGLLDLYETDFNLQWFTWAQDLQKRLDESLWSQEHKVYLYAQRTAGSWAPLVPLEDGSEPSPNGVALLNLFRFYHFTYHNMYKERASELLKSFTPYIEQYPSVFTQTAMALDFSLHPPKEMVLVGEKENPITEEALRLLQKSYFPQKVLSFLDSQNSPLGPIAFPQWEGKRPVPRKFSLYLCQGRACDLPIEDIKKLELYLKNREVEILVPNP